MYLLTRLTAFTAFFKPFALPPAATLDRTLPLSTSDRWIVDIDGNHVPYVGINWAGAADTMLPEGLQWQSISDIVAKITELNLNVVRLTFAIEMVDNILDDGGDVTIQDTLTTALGEANGTTALGHILAHNPQFSANTTRLQVFDAVAAELAAQNVYVHLDNHVSKAMWCCSLTDGNSWFGDTYFNTSNWVRGLSYMAAHGKKNWPTFSSIGLRNELRPSLTGASTLESYTWSTWKSNMVAAASAVYAANPDVLIFLSGLESDFNIEPAVAGSTLLDPSFSFEVSDYTWKNQLVFEMHEYAEPGISDVCLIYQGILERFGFNAVTEEGGNRAPLVISEWGYAEDDASAAYQSVYATCLAGYMVEKSLGFMLWTLAGSYYIRSGVQGSNETYGMLDYSWSTWRGNASLSFMEGVIANIYAAYEQ